MTTPARRRIPFDEYLRLEEYSNVKHEYLDGAIYAMAGGSPRHAALTSQVNGALVSQLRDRPCVVFSSDLRIRVPSTGLATYPDVSVVCGPLQTDTGRSLRCTRSRWYRNTSRWWKCGGVKAGTGRTMSTAPVPVCRSHRSAASCTSTSCTRGCLTTTPERGGTSTTITPSIAWLFFLAVELHLVRQMRWFSTGLTRLVTRGAAVSYAFRRTRTVAPTLRVAAAFTRGTARWLATAATAIVTRGKRGHQEQDSKHHAEVTERCSTYHCSLLARDLDVISLRPIAPAPVIPSATYCAAVSPP